MFLLTANGSSNMQLHQMYQNHLISKLQFEILVYHLLHSMIRNINHIRFGRFPPGEICEHILYSDWIYRRSHVEGPSKRKEDFRLL